ncbi:hypothetical protein [Amycolatopsis suaedae]|uniref:Uncharacterized protein n=1 Tax=Amycolatopsis suaedae TaxID=2510978 RepID=A0A4Q7JC94_9PSEU|nr:hypothetical protein [Amycolatopsis suaedae]RZQ64153.1 hypothetical protein EWH70_09155 [Amycolatopsis suaedae]
MKRMSARVLVAGAALAVLSLVTGGVAGAAETPVWVLPGVDLGGLLGPVAGLPADALAPVYGLLTLLGA